MNVSRLVPLALVSATALVGLAVPAQAAQVRPVIQGVVVDQGGRNVDDVQVLAVRPDGTNAASALSYASDREDGPQHGYFYLAVGAAGSFEVVLSKPGYRTESLGEYDVTRRGVVSLGEVELRKKPVPSTTTCTVADRTLGRGERGSVAVRVTTAATSRPTGTVKLYVDRKRVDDTSLRRSRRGAVHFALPKLAPGSHRVKASWGGTAYVKGSECGATTVTVRRAIDRPVVQRAWVLGSPLLRLLP